MKVTDVDFNKFIDDVKKKVAADITPVRYIEVILWKKKPLYAKYNANLMK